LGKKSLRMSIEGGENSQNKEGICVRRKKKEGGWEEGVETPNVGSVSSQGRIYLTEKAFSVFEGGKRSGYAHEDESQRGCQEGKVVRGESRERRRARVFKGQKLGKRDVYSKS